MLEPLDFDETVALLLLLMESTSLASLSFCFGLPGCILSLAVLVIPLPLEIAVALVRC